MLIRPLLIPLQALRIGHASARLDIETTEDLLQLQVSMRSLQRT